MATQASVLAWKIPGMAEPGGLPSMGLHRIGYNWSNLAAAAASWSWGPGAMAANSSLLGSICSLVPVQVAQRDPRDSPFQDLQDWHAVPSQGSRPVGSVSLEGPSGLPKGTVVRVHVGQIMSIHTKQQDKEYVTEVLLGAKFKLPGHQKIHISKKWGFTKFNEDKNMGTEEQLTVDGCGVKYITNHGPLDKWQTLHS